LLDFLFGSAMGFVAAAHHAMRDRSCKPGSDLRAPDETGDSPGNDRFVRVAILGVKSRAAVRIMGR